MAKIYRVIQVKWKTSVCTRIKTIKTQVLIRVMQVCVQPPTSAVNVTLLAFAAERRRLLQGARSSQSTPVHQSMVYLIQRLS